MKNDPAKPTPSTFLDSCLEPHEEELGFLPAFE